MSDARPILRTIEFFADDSGRKVVLQWIKKDLTPIKRRAIGHAMREILQKSPKLPAGRDWTRRVDKGLFEFRLEMSGKELLNLEADVRGITVEELRATGEFDASEAILLRVFYHPHGDQIILLLGAYDKGKDTNEKRQEKEIAIAKKRLQIHKDRLAKEAKAQRKNR